MAGLGLGLVQELGLGYELNIKSDAYRYTTVVCQAKVKFKLSVWTWQNYRQLSFLHCFNGNFGVNISS